MTVSHKNHMMQSSLMSILKKTAQKRLQNYTAFVQPQWEAIFFLILQLTLHAMLTKRGKCLETILHLNYK